ncbi:MAG: DUF2804 domain-containing protein [Sandaracinaceae bacterium]|nr:DUF2804 domain-containing protein [Sandaracinaceae bacterium]
MIRRRSPAPASLVSNGRFAFGVFDGPIRRVNPLDAARPFSLPLPRAVHAWRLKEWQAFQLAGDRFFVLLALFDAKMLALAQAKVYDRETGRKYLFERKLPPWKLRIASGLGRSETRYRAGGLEMAFHNRLDHGRIEIDLHLPAEGAFPGLSGSVVARTSGYDPLVVALPFARNRGMYSHKGPASLEGELRLGEETIRFDPAVSQLLIDDHKGYYPREMKWDWVTAAGRDSAGRRVAFNLTRNQAIDPGRYNENCVWVNGRAHLLPPVRFEREGCKAGDRWTIQDEQGRVDVRFEVEVEGRVDIRALVLRSDYDGPFGTFRGGLADDDGNSICIDGLFGMGERFCLSL